MGLQKSLRILQDRARNAGWRIRHIPWQEPGKPEYIHNSRTSRAMIVGGLLGFFGGIGLAVESAVPVWTAIAIAVGGLATLLASRFVAGRDQYGKFVRVDAVCVDREMREIDDPDPDSGAFWHARILCEFDYQGRTWRVTPVIPVFVANRKRRGLENFLDKRIGRDGSCVLWINPDNPLETVLHKKPRMAAHTV